MAKMVKADTRSTAATGFPHTDGDKTYLLDGIPAELWQAVRARAAAEGRSVRYVILALLEGWAEPLEAKNARALETLRVVTAAARKGGRRG
jgi:hypothetical protein